MYYVSICRYWYLNLICLHFAQSYICLLKHTHQSASHVNMLLKQMILQNALNNH